MTQQRASDRETERESFVVWVDAASSAPGRLRGTAEWTRRSERIGFGSFDELERFLEHCLSSPLRREPARALHDDPNRQQKEELE